MKNWVFLFISGLFLLGGSLYGNDLPEIKQLLEDKTNFTTQQVTNILNLIDSANKENLPVEILISRLKEGVARKSNFQTVLEVINKKTNSLRQAHSLIAAPLNKGISVENKKYSHQLLAELLERGLSSDDFNFLADLALSRNMKLDELVRLCEILVRNKEEGLRVEHSKEIISLAIVKKLDMKAIDYTNEIIREELQSRHLKAEEIKDTIIAGLSKHRSIRKIKEAIKEKVGLERITEETHKRKTSTERMPEINEELKQKGIEEKERHHDKRGR